MIKSIYILFILIVGVSANEKNNNEIFTKKICTQCHNFDIVLDQKGDTYFWNKIIESMYGNGLQKLNGKEKNKIINFLSQKNKNEIEQKFRRKPLQY
jgi:uncharacterized protein YaaW (UPF0174 family)